nr:MAG TPA: hypothetical protein [Caudoviricetes sp.]
MIRKQIDLQKVVRQVILRRKDSIRLQVEVVVVDL